MATISTGAIIAFFAVMLALFGAWWLYSQHTSQRRVKKKAKRKVRITDKEFEEHDADFFEEEVIMEEDE